MMIAGFVADVCAGVRAASLWLLPGGHGGL